VSGPARQPFTDADLEQLAGAGIAVEEAERQLALLAEPPRAVRLLRPCTVGDGVERLVPGRFDELVALGEEVRDRGRLTKFVPASGAASRMFRAIATARAAYPGATYEELAAADDPDARRTAELVDALPRLALLAPLAAAMGTDPSALLSTVREGSLEPLLAALLDPGGLDAAALPKALLPFHRAPEGARPALVEQLLEGLGYLVDREGVARYHFTVPPGAGTAFAAAVEQARRLAGGRIRLEVGTSEQSRSTDTLALEADGGPARDESGRLLLRPAGHGALLANLEASGADLALIKNIDNVLPEARHPEIARFKLALAGRLAELERQGRSAERPVRVCGVVPSTGEPGGGPFWIETPSGPLPAPQIVESSQVDLAEPSQRATFEASTHFNPVDLAVALRDSRDRPHRLAQFVDPTTSFVAVKGHAGRRIRVLERPGLWNGAMAGWETVLVEVPLWTFAPVKTVLDLARPEHAAAPT